MRDNWDCAGDFRANADEKNTQTQNEDSSNAAILKHSAQDSRIFTQNAANEKVDSRSEAQNLKTPAQDSRICKNAQNVFSQNATRRQDLESLESTFDNNEQATQKVDSRENAPILNDSTKDSRICDEKSVLSSDWQGSYLEGNDRRLFRRIADLSRKAESTSQAQKPTPEPFYGVGDSLQTTYTKAEQYAIIAEVERRCKQYLDPSFDPASFIYPRDNFALTAEVESLCVFRQSLESSFSLSLAGAAEAVDSSVDCHAAAAAAARNDDKKVDSSFSAHNATILKHSAQDSRILEIESTFGVASSQAQANLDSRKSPSDSRIFDKNAQNVFSPNADRRQDLESLESTFDKNEQATQKADSGESPSDSKILDEKCGLQGKSQGSYLSGSDRRDFSPLPHFSLKAESPQVDSRILELESGFFKPRKEIRLECLSTQRGDEIRDSSPKAESTRDKPLFTIAIPTYNRITLLRRAILSALAQDFDKPYEIIVVENPLEPIHYAAESMLQEFAHRITYYQNAQNIGGLGNWNRCLELASGKWVCLLHSDDELLPSYLSTMHALATSPAYSQALLIGAIEDASDVYPRTRLQKLYAKCISQARLQKLQMRVYFDNGFCYLPPRAMLHNRAKCIEIGGYDESEAPSGDMTFFNRAALCGEVFCYRAELLTRNHYEASSCKDPNVALMMILQNPQMFLGFRRKLTHAQLMGNHLWWSRYFAHLPLLRLYAQMRLSQQLTLFGVHPSWQERAKGYMKEHCYTIFATLKAIKSLLTGRTLDAESMESKETASFDEATQSVSDSQSKNADSSTAHSLSGSTPSHTAKVPPPR